MSKLDFNELERRFSLALLQPHQTVYSVRADLLLDIVQVQALITRLVPIVKAWDTMVAAVYFTRWLSGISLAQQYFISHYNTALDLSLPNLTVHVLSDGESGGICFQIEAWSELAAPADVAQRIEWRYRVLRSMYSETIRPLFERLALAASIPLHELWDQWPAMFNARAEAMERATWSDEGRQRLAADMLCLKYGLEPPIFGLSHNPFAIEDQFVPHIADPAQTVRVPHACCLHHRTEGGVYCYNCPHLEEEYRAIRRIHYRTGSRS